MLWIGTMALATCFFVSPPHPIEELPEVDPHEFLNRVESCTCCHETGGAEGSIEPHEFTSEIPENCTRCHTEEMIGISHPVGSSPSERFPEMEVPEALPVDEQDRITCGTCHNPHLPGYSRERYTKLQRPMGTREEENVEIAYYKSYRLRLHQPDAGNDPTCAACHVEYF